MTVRTLEDRLQALEDQQAILALKARYLAACDAKDPSTVRACFCDGEVDIDYGPVGRFSRADELVKIYTQIACHPHMLEWHHGSNSQISLLSADRASGKSSLQYQLINTQDLTLTQLGGVYVDEYQRTPQGWKIRATKFEPRTMLSLKLSDDAVKCLAAGTPAAPELMSKA